MSQSAPHFFATFYVFPGRFSHPLQHIKNLETQFSVSPKYGLFSLSTWSKNKNFDLYHKTSIIHFLKNKQFQFYGKSRNSYFLTMLKMNIGHILPKRKIGVPNFLHVDRYVKIYQERHKKMEKSGGRLTNFCLGPKSKIARHSTVLAVRSQVLVTGIST